jgi:cysteinyl-tRNA synthetase
MSRIPLRVRLTLAFAAAMAAVLAAVGTFVYVRLDGSLTDQLDESLRTRAAALVPLASAGSPLGASGDETVVEIEGEKMSKSLHNFVTLSDALDAHDPRAFRMAVLQVHYRKAMDLGDDELRAAASAVARLDSLVRRADAAGIDWPAAQPDDDIVGRFRDAMDDDFGTPAAVAVGVFDPAASANQAIDAGDSDRAASLVATVVQLAAALGLVIGGSTDTGEHDAEIDQLVRERDAARANKDFATADRLRDELTARGIILEDTPSGTVWHRA